MLGIKHPDIGPAHTRCGELWIVGTVLAAMGRSNKGAALLRPAEDDVAWLVTDQQRAHYAAVLEDMRVDDADTVREVIDDPDFVGTPDCDRHRFETNRD